MSDIAEISRIPVSTGFTWTSVFTGGSFVALIGLVSLIIRNIGPWRKQLDEAEDARRVALNDRIRVLEEKLDDQDRKADAQRAKHEAERALDRHKIRNLTQCLDALLMVLEAAPEKAIEIVAKVRAMRDAQIVAEAAEAAAIHAAEIVAEARTGTAV